jgi:selenocysteine-specific elongation factor
MPTRLITVELCLLPYLRHPLRHNAEVNFHVGTAETMAKVKLLESDKLQPGETGWVQLSLDKPVASVKGDHCVIRSAMETLGGGEIIESHARRYRRFRPHIVQSLSEKKLGTPEEVVIATLEASQPLEFMALMAQSELSADEVQVAIESLIEREEVIMLGQREHSLLMTTSGWENITDGVISILQDYHRKFKARLGMPKAELSSRLKLGELSSALFGKLSEKGRIVEEGSIIRLCTHRVQLTLGQQAKISSFLQALEQDPYSPPGDLIPEPDLLNLLIDRHQVVKVSDGVVFPIAAYNEMVAGITSHLKIKGKVTLAEARNMFNTSRKYALALLEYLDRRKVTRRVGDARVPYQKRDI